MVRASPKMELIKNEKARNLSFQRRKTSLKKKLDELSTLCGVKALMLVYGPNNKPAEPELWPTNNRRVKVHQLFNKYKNQSRDDRKKRTVNLSHYFQGRKRKADSELEKLRKTNAAEEAKKTKLEQKIDDLGKEKLREFNSLLDNQIAAAKARFDLVTNNHNRNSNVIVFSQPEVPEKSNHPQPLSVIYPQEPLVCYPRPIAAIYPQQPPRPRAAVYPQQPPRPRAAIYPQQPLEQQQQQHGLGASFGANLTPNSRAVVLWNNNGCAGACGSNIVYAPLNSVPVYYCPMPSGMVTRNMRASRMCYYYGGQVVQQPMPQYYVQNPRMTRAAAAAAAASSHQVRASQTERYY